MPGLVIALAFICIALAVHELIAGGAIDSLLIFLWAPPFRTSVRELRQLRLAFFIWFGCVMNLLSDAAAAMYDETISRGLIREDEE